MFPPTQRHVIRRGLGILRMSIRLQPKPFTFGLMGAALYAAMTVAEAVVLGRVTDEVIVPAVQRGSVTTATLVGAVVAIMSVAVLKGIGIIGRRAGAFLMQFRLQADFRCGSDDHRSASDSDHHDPEPLLPCARRGACDESSGDQSPGLRFGARKLRWSAGREDPGSRRRGDQAVCREVRGAA